MIRDTIFSRRSIRHYTSQKVERALIEELIEVAIQAPSASNKQGWRFFVVEDTALIQQMAQQIQNDTEAIAQYIPASTLPHFQNYGTYFIRFQDAPVVIVPIYRELAILSNLVSSELPSEHLASIHEMEKTSGLVSVSLAIQNLMLYAHSIGLGTSCMTGPLISSTPLKKILLVPDSWSIAAFIPLGYPAEQPEPPARKNLKTVLRWVSSPSEKKE